MKGIVLVAVGVLASGCVSIQKRPLDPGAEQTVTGKRLGATKHKKPDFSAMTAGKAMFGLIGAAAMISAGNEIINENQVEDPARAIADELAKGLERKYRVVRLAGGTAEAESDEVDDLVKGNPDAELLLDVRTINWSFAYFPTDWTHYRVIYTARARLIDAKTKNVLAEGGCKRIPEKTDDAPTRDDLLKGNAARLKRELQLAAGACIETLRSEIFHLSAEQALGNVGP